MILSIRYWNKMICADVSSIVLQLEKMVGIELSTELRTLVCKNMGDFGTRVELIDFTSVLDDAACYLGDEGLSGALVLFSNSLKKLAGF